MKKILVSLFVFTLIFTLAGCGVKQEDYDAAVSDASAAHSELDSTKTELDKTKSDLKKLQEENSTLSKEYNDYKESMKPFEEMTAAQAEAEKAKAEQEKQKIAEEEAAKKAAEEKAASEAAAEEKAAKEAEEAKGYETGITYEQLARTPDNYLAKKIKFSGKVIQVIEDSDEIQIRLAVDGDYDNVILCGYDPSITGTRILDDDYVTIYGVSIGTVTYESTLGGNITIPAAYLDKIEIS